MIKIEERKTQKLPGLTSLFLQSPYSARLLEIVKQCDVRDFNKKTKEWELPVANLAYLIDSLSCISDIDITLHKSTPKKIVAYDLMNHKTKPFPHQEDAIKFGLNNSCFLLLDAPGLGKTLDIICLAEELKAREGLEHCFIVCGIATLKNNWKEEILKHSRLSCTILGEKTTKTGKTVIGSVSDRANQLKKTIKEFFVITNIETLRSEEVIKSIKSGKNKFDMMVVDECHTCKSNTSIQSKNLQKIKDVKHKIGLTGTLFLNNPVDAYVPLHWIGAERGTYSSFKYFYSKFGGNFGNDLLGFRNLDYLKDQLETCSLRRGKELLNLPEKTVIHEVVELNDKQKQFYQNIVKGIVDQVDKVHISSSEVLSLVGRLRQATAYPGILTTENIESSKLERCVDLVDQIISNNEKVVIFSTFKDTLNPLVEKLSKYNPVLCTGDVSDEDISKNKKSFQEDDNTKVFLATWQKCGTGITLTAASYAIFIDTPWTQGQCLQAEDRIHRIGSKKPVTIYYLEAKDTVDEDVKQIVQDKSIMSDYIVDEKIPPVLVERLKQIIIDL